MPVPWSATSKPTCQPLFLTIQTILFKVKFNSSSILFFGKQPTTSEPDGQREEEAEESEDDQNINNHQGSGDSDSDQVRAMQGIIS